MPQAHPLDDVTQLYCDFRQYGWNELIIAQQGEIRTFRVSGVFTDFPVEILRICEAAIENLPLRVALCDEPGGAVIDIKCDATQQHSLTLTIYEIDRPLSGFDANEEGNPILSVRMRRQRFVGMLMAELWKAHVSLKHPSYQKGREVFPHKELLRVNTLWDNSPVGPSFLR